MLLSFFKKSQLSVVILVVIISAAIWLKTFMNGLSYPFIFDTINMPLYAILVKYINHSIILSNIITFSLVMAIAFYLLHLNSKFIIIKQRTYLPALFYLLISTAFIPIQRINPAIFATFFILLALDHIFAIYQKGNPLDNLFRAGISLGIASLFYAPAIPFYLIIFMGLLLLRAFSLREWFVAMLGIALPWGFLMLTYFWLNIDISQTFELVKSNLITDTESSIDELIPIIFTSAIGLPTIVALFYLIPSMANQKISVRKYHTLFFWILFIGAASFALIPTASYEMAYILAIPLSFQLTNYFANARKGFWAEVLFTLIIIAALAIQLYFTFA
ncbi:MAG TPA: DUF6427 family protein [Tenuifilaceae bacterium]|nr:DUF6427 family protein [Tenuifilaceae bacterium]